MLWLCLHPHRLALDVLAAARPAAATDPQPPLAVTHRHGNRRWVVASDGGDDGKPVFPGLDAALLMAARPDTRLLDRDPRAEGDALQQLAWLAHRWGQPVSLDHDAPSPDHPQGQPAVWVEIGRSLRLFGGVDALLADVRHHLASEEAAGLPDCRLGVAPTPEAARLAARLGAPRPLADADSLFDWLRQVPVAQLRLPAAVREDLAGSGVRRVEQLLALPVDQLARRFGPAVARDLDRLFGRAPDPRRAVRPPAHFSRLLDFDGEVHSSEALLFPLRRLLGALAHYLVARDRGVLALRLRLLHEGGHDTPLELRLATPSRDAAHLLLMARERLARAPLPAPVRGLAIEAEQFAAPPTPQLDLFDTHQASDDAWRTTLERLAARLGDDALWQPGLVPDHRPERAWQRLAPHAEGPVLPAPRAPRPVWLVDPPRPLPHAPQVDGRPERIEAGWWDGSDAARDYYIARDDNRQQRLWVYRDRRDGRWFLHGMWA